MLRAILITTVFLGIGCTTTRFSNSTRTELTSYPTIYQSGYAPVNGLKIYYEVHGQGSPLVLLHGGGSTIESTFGRVLGELAKNRKVIAIEERAHGRSSDLPGPLTFEGSADNVAAVMDYLKIQRADVLGFSNGGNVAMRLAMRYPKRVRKLVLASSFFRHDGLYTQFWEGMQNAKLENMPQGLKDAFLKVNPDPKKLQNMHDKDAARMLKFEDWEGKDMRLIRAPTLVIIGDKDVVLPEHAVEMTRQISGARLLVLPGLHGEYLGEATVSKAGNTLPNLTLDLVEDFLGTKGM